MTATLKPYCTKILQEAKGDVPMSLTHEVGKAENVRENM